MATPATGCELCATAGGELLWQSERCRVVRVDDADYPGFCRVIWNRHVREMTDLPTDERQELMAVVFAVESVVRKFFSPDKINLASLGNMTPHVHWHIIPRWQTDKHFPQPIWGTPQRGGKSDSLVVVSSQDLRNALAEALATVEVEKK